MVAETKIIDGKKLCSCCKQIKAVEFFGPSKLIKCGLRGECFECRANIYKGKDYEKNKEARRRYYAENKDSIDASRLAPEYRRYQREYYAKNAEKLRKRNNKYKYLEVRKKEKQKFKLKISARKKFNRAISRGQFVRATSCQSCMSEGKIEAHHKDYTKPYEVEWLCRSCHKRRHYNYD
jgi:hypothetical protein